MTDIINEQLKAAELKAAEANKLKQELVDGNLAIKSSIEKGNGEIKASIDSLVETMKKNNENMIEQSNLLVKSNKEVIVAKGSKGLKDTIEKFENEIKSISVNIIENTASEKEKGIFESGEFKNYLKERALNITKGNESKANLLVAEAEQEYKDAKDASQKGRLIPLIQTKSDGIYRESVGADGGFVARPTVEGVLREIWNYNLISMRDMAQNVNIQSTSYTVPLEFQGVEVFWEGEETANVKESSTNYGKVEIKTGTLKARGKITRTLKEDSSIDLYNRYIINVNNEITKVENDAFYKGIGQNDRPMGLFSNIYKTIDKNAPFEKNAFRSYTYTATGTLATDIASLLNTIQECIINTEEYIMNQSIWMNPDLYTKIMQAKDNMGRYLVDPSMPRMMNGIKVLFGLPVITSKQIPSVIANNQLAPAGKGVFIGNMNEVYTIIDRLSLVGWMDIITDDTYIKFFTRKRLGGGAIGFNKGSMIEEKA